VGPSFPRCELYLWGRKGGGWAADVIFRHVPSGKLRGRNGVDLWAQSVLLESVCAPAHSTLLTADSAGSSC
jgi:hypothetical protein